MTKMSTAAKASSERRKAYVRRIISNDSVEDIYSDERKEQWELFSDAEKKQIKESKVFIGFVRVSGLSTTPRTKRTRNRRFQIFSHPSKAKRTISWRDRRSGPGLGYKRFGEHGRDHRLSIFTNRATLEDVQGEVRQVIPHKWRTC